MQTMGAFDNFGSFLWYSIVTSSSANVGIINEDKIITPITTTAIFNVVNGKFYYLDKSDHIRIFQYP